MLLKTCFKCKTAKPVESFGKNRSRSNGIGCYCRECRKLLQKNYYKKNPEKFKTYRNKNLKAADLHKHKSNLKVSFGIDVAAYENQYIKQLGACAICSGQNLSGKRLAVDHDHTSGKIRGLLCTTCNTGLGQFKDSIDLLERAATYLSSGGVYHTQ